MATAARRPKTPSPKAPAKAAKAAQKAAPKKPKRIRGEFAMPEVDHERIARLKAVAKRGGIDVKKNELLRMGLQALQSLSSGELLDRIRVLRLPAKPAKT